MLKKNIGCKERVARIVIGGAILKMGKKHQSKLGLLGMVPLLTGLTGYCPAYQKMGMDTTKNCGQCKKSKQA